jgi:acyl carrier protein
MITSHGAFGQNLRNSDNGFAVDEAQIQDWLVARVAALVGQLAENLDVTMAFDRIGLDSVHAVELAGEVQQYLGQDVDPTLLYEYVTIQSLAQYVARQLRFESCSDPAPMEGTTTSS